MKELKSKSIYLNQPPNTYLLLFLNPASAVFANSSKSPRIKGVKTLSTCLKQMSA